MKDKKSITRQDYITQKEITEYNIDLKKIEEKYNNNEELDHLEKYLLVLILKDEKKLKEVSKGDAILEGVVNKIIELSKDKELIEEYENEKRRRKSLGLPEDDFHLKIILTETGITISNENNYDEK